MRAFTKHQGKVVTMDRADVDTDQIIPKDFLKRIQRTGFEDCLFYSWRFDVFWNFVCFFIYSTCFPAATWLTV